MKLRKLKTPKVVSIMGNLWARKLRKCDMHLLFYSHWSGRNFLVPWVRVRDRIRVRVRDRIRVRVRVSVRVRVMIRLSVRCRLRVRLVVWLGLSLVLG